MNKTKIKGIIKRIFIVLLIALVAIQFFRPVKNASAEITDQDITRLYPVPDSVLQVLHKACYDCHSNNTRYPWYYNIQPVAWWMNDHIKEGKRELNFSEFGKRPLPKRSRKLHKASKEVDEGEMPIDSYLWIHKDAKLTDAEKQMVLNFFNTLSVQIGTDTLKSKG